MAFWLIALARISCASFPALKSAFSLSLIDPQVGQFPAHLPFSFRDTSRNLTLPSNRGSVQGAGDASGWPGHINSVPILGSPLPPAPAQALLLMDLVQLCPEDTRRWKKDLLCTRPGAPGEGVGGWVVLEQDFRTLYPTHQCAGATHTDLEAPIPHVSLHFHV